MDRDMMEEEMSGEFDKTSHQNQVTQKKPKRKGKKKNGKKGVQRRDASNDSRDSGIRIGGDNYQDQNGGMNELSETEEAIRREICGGSIEDSMNTINNSQNNKHSNSPLN